MRRAHEDDPVCRPDKMPTCLGAKSVLRKNARMQKAEADSASLCIACIVYQVSSWEEAGLRSATLAVVNLTFLLSVITYRKPNLSLADTAIQILM